MKTFRLSPDPRFVEKLRNVVELFLFPPERAIVFSFDEKSQSHALDRTQPGLPLKLKKGRSGAMTHDYKRHGTTTFFAALQVATGKVIHECMPRHRHQDFLRFLKSVKKGAGPNLELHFIPTSASWMNLVERFFSDLTQRQLKRLAVSSVDQLESAIHAYIDARDEVPTLVVWPASAEPIAEKVQRGNKTLATLHNRTYQSDEKQLHTDNRIQAWLGDAH